MDWCEASSPHPVGNLSERGLRHGSLHRRGLDVADEGGLMPGDTHATPAGQVIAIGASAGGVDVLRTLLRDLPEDFPAPVLIVLHLLATGNSVLPRIIGRDCPLPVAFAEHGQSLDGGRVYVAPPDHHLEVSAGGVVVLSHGPRENGTRPAIDALLRSAARSYGARAVGVVLSGNLDDGSAGLTELVKAGGIAIVQDPADAAYPDMPRNAIEHATPQHVLPLRDIPAMLIDLADARAEGADIVPEMVAGDDVRPARNSEWGMSCPDCNGVLHQVGTRPLQFRCRVGHFWTQDSLMDERDVQIENALWIAVRSLEEKKELLERMAKQRESSGHRHSAALVRARVADTDTALTVLRDLLLRPVGASNA
jgi:two-component system chemotaxis response regulator CheB